MLQATSFELCNGGISLLSLTGMEHYENLHSDIIQSFLEKIPESRESFLLLLNQKFNNAFGNYKIIETKREASLQGMGRADLVLFLRRKPSYERVVVIENKIWASDQKNQLKRYYEYFKKQYGNENVFFCYLTFEGRNPSEYSITRDELKGLGAHYSSISYKKDILTWLDDTKKNLTNELVSSAIVQYKLAIQGVLKMSDKSEELKKNWYESFLEYDLDKMKVVEQAIHSMNETRTKLKYFCSLRQQMCASLSEKESSRVVYVCNQKIVGTDDREFQSKVVEELGPCIGLVFNAEIPEKGKPCYGIGIEWQGMNDKERSYLGVLLGGDESMNRDNPKKLVLDVSKEYMPDSFSYLWGESWEWTSYVDRSDVITVSKTLRELVDKQNEKFFL
ncbi:MAG: PD-(D/E)XK nuclease family protein [Spirochaetia bacterium]|nr:PD-(D/E)XK nuclease family protein [Spirochaetia bacterium]